MQRFTINELNSMSNKKFAALILSEELGKRGNPYTPIANKLRSAISELEGDAEKRMPRILTQQVMPSAEDCKNDPWDVQESNQVASEDPKAKGPRMNRLTYREADGRARLTDYGKAIYCSTQATADILADYEERLEGTSGEPKKVKKRCFPTYIR